MTTVSSVKPAAETVAGAAARRADLRLVAGSTLPARGAGPSRQLRRLPEEASGLVARGFRLFLAEVDSPRMEESEAIRHRSILDPSLRRPDPSHPTNDRCPTDRER